MINPLASNVDPADVIISMPPGQLLMCVEHIMLCYSLILNDPVQV